MLDLTRTRHGTPVVGIAGWKNSGKTTLAERLIETLTRRGYRIASVKHAHHAFEIDDGQTDSARHRRAGAAQVAIVGAARTAVITELQGAAEPSLDDVLADLAPADLIVVEGYKRAAITKFEVRAPGRGASDDGDLAGGDPMVIAIVGDVSTAPTSVPLFSRDDIDAIAAFVITAGRLRVLPEPGP